MKASAHIIVKGLVQGVSFRWFVQKEANSLELAGYVRNLFNGDVEVEVEGEKVLIEELIKMLKIGNRFSNVTDVQVSWKDFEAKFNSFKIRF